MAKIYFLLCDKFIARQERCPSTCSKLHALELCGNGECIDGCDTSMPFVCSFAKGK